MKFMGESDEVRHLALRRSVVNKCEPHQPTPLFFFLRGFFSFINFVSHCCGQAHPKVQVC